MLLWALAGPAGAQAGITLASDSTVDARRLGRAATAPALPETERLLLLALEAIAAARLDDAESRLGTLLARQPQFHLARLVLADVLLARSGRIVDFAAGAPAEHVDALRSEALARLANARNSAVSGRLPEVLLQLSDSQRSAVVVDLAASRLYLYSNGGEGPRLAGSFYVSVGKNGAPKSREGDQRTPVGVYFVTGSIPGAKLPDFYGPGALPVNYPNEWDVRQRRTGHGIWIHGVPSDTYSRAPRASDGCMALSNDNVDLLLNLPQTKDTPVIIADGLVWQDGDSLAARRAELRAALEAWRRDWESLDVDRYARHYARDFRSEEGDLEQWMSHKRRVNAAKRFVRVALDDVSMFAYPGERDMVVVTFDQEYKSSNFAERASKRQYWRREADGGWRIVFEGAVKLRSEHLRGIPFSARSRLSMR